MPQVSYPQQIAVTATGLIWSRFSTQINPVLPASLDLAEPVSEQGSYRKN